MSQPRQIEILCPQCGQKITATAYDSINTDLAANVAETIINGDRFKVKCPKCKIERYLEYDLLYHDMKHGAMIWVVHPNQEGYEEKASEIRTFSPDFWATTRLVPHMNALREKVACLEAGVDDRIIEICKVFLENEVAKQRPEFQLDNAFYTFQGQKQVILLYDCDGKRLSCTLDTKLYAMIETLFGKALREMKQEPFPVIDRDWALEFMVNVDPEAMADENIERLANTPQEPLAAPKMSTEQFPEQLTSKERIAEEKEHAEFQAKEPLPPTQPQPAVRPVPVTRKKQRESMPQEKPISHEKQVQKTDPPTAPASAVFCRKCGFKLIEGSAFCSMCGTPVIKPDVVCPKCGSKLPEDAAFCHKCGATVTR